MGFSFCFVLFFLWGGGNGIVMNSFCCVDIGKSYISRQGKRGGRVVTLTSWIQDFSIG